MLPVEVTHEAPRVMAYDETTSTEALQDDVDALDGNRAYETTIVVEFVHDPLWWEI
jgi:hypothetical protein